MTFLFLFISCIAFVEMLIFLKLELNLKATFLISRESLAVIRSPELSDREKENAVRSNSLALFKIAFLLMGKFTLIAVGLFLIYLAGVYLANIPRDLITEWLLSPLVWLLLSLFSVLYVWNRNVIRKRL